MIYTVGYQRLSLRRLDELLECLDIKHLVDVRKKPFSHIAGYSSGGLLARYGDEKYLMKGKVLGGGGNVTEEGIEWLKQFYSEDAPNVMLMCMEDHPQDCHRHMAICAPHFPKAIDYFDGKLVEVGELERATLSGDDECELIAEITFTNA